MERRSQAFTSEISIQVRKVALTRVAMDTALTAWGHSVQTGHLVQGQGILGSHIGDPHPLKFPSILEVRLLVKQNKNLPSALILISHIIRAIVLATH